MNSKELLEYLKLRYDSIRNEGNLSDYDERYFSSLKSTIKQLFSIGIKQNSKIRDELYKTIQNYKH